MSRIRLQLSLFVCPQLDCAIEQVREIVDPLQKSLIPAHITLCREDELATHKDYLQRLKNIPFLPLKLSFSAPQIFDGHGIQMVCIEGESQFRRLREYVLNNNNLRRQLPHLTLAHPRNTQAIGNSMKNTAALANGVKLVFNRIHLIQQIEGNPWEICQQFDLMPSPRASN